MGFDLTGLGSVFDLGSKILDKIWPNKDEADKAKLALLQMQQNGELKGLEQEFNLAIEQIKVNAVEAESPSTFVSGWRPFVGWVCGVAFAYNYVFMPFIVYVVHCFNTSLPGMPTLEMSELSTLLMGMLGLGAMRSYDKKNGVASK
jgi:hypothetical protein